MENLTACLLVQLFLGFGVAGLLWPERVKPLYGVLMFPWPASYRAVRAHSFIAIAAYFLVLGKLFLVG